MRWPPILDVGVEASPRPLGPLGRALAALIAAGAAAMWASSLYVYSTLPEGALIPAQFSLSGEPIAYGPKSELLWEALLLSLIPSAFLALVRLRFALVRRLPYIVPSLILDRLRVIGVEERGAWVNRYFEALLGLGASLTYIVLALYLTVLEGRLAGHLEPIPFELLVLASLTLSTGFTLSIAWISRQLAKRLASRPA